MVLDFPQFRNSVVFWSMRSLYALNSGAQKDVRDFSGRKPDFYGNQKNVDTVRLKIYHQNEKEDKTEETTFASKQKHGKTRRILDKVVGRTESWKTPTLRSISVGEDIGGRCERKATNRSTSVEIHQSDFLLMNSWVCWALWLDSRVGTEFVPLFFSSRFRYFLQPNSACSLMGSVRCCTHPRKSAKTKDPVTKDLEEFFWFQCVALMIICPFTVVVESGIERVFLRIQIVFQGS